MKQVILLAALFGFIQFSCSRNDAALPAPTALTGQWRMALVQDNATGSIITKPADTNGEVDVLFTATGATNGHISGKTPTNDIWPSNYQTGTAQSIAIPALGITKVMETTWGNEFVNNICSSQSYAFESGGRLKIKTNRKTLIFQQR